MRAPGPAAVPDRDLLLILLTVSSGAVDAISFLALGKVFTAFTTGNLVFLGIGIGGPGGPRLAEPLVSVAAFAVGVLLAGAVTGTRQTSRALVLAAGFETVFLLVWVSVSRAPGEIDLDLLIGLSAVSMGHGSDRDGGHSDGRRTGIGERVRLVQVLAALIAGAAAGRFCSTMRAPTRRRCRPGSRRWQRSASPGPSPGRRAPIPYPPPADARHSLWRTTQPTILRSWPRGRERSTASWCGTSPSRSISSVLRASMGI